VALSRRFWGKARALAAMATFEIFIALT